MPPELPWFELWAVLGAAVGLLGPLAATVHVVLHKREVRAALGWVGFVWFVPVLGALSYLLFGINRVRRAAHRRGRGQIFNVHVPSPDAPPSPGSEHPYARALAAISRRPVVGGCAVRMLRDGDRAYPAMLDAIERARTSITFCSYLFDNDDVGALFCDALEAAHARGVQVRVLVDAIGVRYSMPAIDRRLRRAGITVARFMPIRWPWRFRTANLRTHRKILVVDGVTGFTGGMNIRADHWLSRGPSYPTHDTHFELRGPIVRHLQEVFAEDWQYTAGERLPDDPWFPELEAAGATVAATIVDGPDEDLDRCLNAMLAALAIARERVVFVTPYFLPELTMISAFRVATLRGIEVEILIPERSNLRVVDWACWAQLRLVERAGCTIWRCGGTFDHSKLMVVDDEWVLMGSANVDPRSLRLNFELNVACEDAALAREVLALVDARRANARRVTAELLASRSLVLRVRDGIARLGLPYL